MSKLFQATTGIATILFIAALSLFVHREFGGRSVFNYQTRQRHICQGPTTMTGCVVPIGHTVDAATPNKIVSNAFQGGAMLPMQLLGSTFNGKMYYWDSENQTTDGDALWSVDRIDGLPNGTTVINWGSDRNDGKGLANKATTEQCTGSGILANGSNPVDFSCGWETGVIYSSSLAVSDQKVFQKLPFIHIWKVDLDDQGKPSKLRMWEAMVEDEYLSFQYIEQLKNNIGAKTIFGSDGAWQTLTTTAKYSPYGGKSDYRVYYMETNYDNTRGIDPPSTQYWSQKVVRYTHLFKKPVPK